jgi:hypothetical protein
MCQTIYGPYSGLTLRRLNCRRCGAEGPVPGVVYCDPCRPERLTDELMSELDWARERELGR